MTLRDPHRNCFGRLVVRPELLSYRAKVDVARRQAGRWQASEILEDQWFGAGLTVALHEGRELFEVLGLKPPAGSRMTPRAIVQTAERDALIQRLVVAVGSQTRAARILRGDEHAPACASALLTQLRAMGPLPRSRRSVVRAVQRAGLGGGAA